MLHTPHRPGLKSIWNQKITSSAQRNTVCCRLDSRLQTVTSSERVFALTPSVLDQMYQMQYCKLFITYHPDFNIPNRDVDYNELWKSTSTNRTDEFQMLSRTNHSKYWAVKKDFEAAFQSIFNQIQIELLNRAAKSIVPIGHKQNGHNKKVMVKMSLFHVHDCVPPGIFWKP